MKLLFAGDLNFRGIEPLTAEKSNKILAEVQPFLQAFGADDVIAGHTHCPQGYEMYDGKAIVYSMGNFLFRNVVSFSSGCRTGRIQCVSSFQSRQLRSTLRSSAHHPFYHSGETEKARLWAEKSTALQKLPV